MTWTETIGRILSYFDSSLAEFSYYKMQYTYSVNKVSNNEVQSNLDLRTSLYTYFWFTY